MQRNRPSGRTVTVFLLLMLGVAGLRPLRGDDLFTPTDILDDIWRGITGARHVIADISGRNPNVLYELGIAHTLAKPALILSRSVENIPIDLATLRLIAYGSAWLARDPGRAGAGATAGDVARLCAGGAEGLTRGSGLSGVIALGRNRPSADEALAELDVAKLPIDVSLHELHRRQHLVHGSVEPRRLEVQLHLLGGVARHLLV